MIIGTWRASVEFSSGVQAVASTSDDSALYENRLLGVLTGRPRYTFS